MERKGSAGRGVVWTKASSVRVHIACDVCQAPDLPPFHPFLPYLQRLAAQESIGVGAPGPLGQMVSEQL